MYRADGVCADTGAENGGGDAGKDGSGARSASAEGSSC